MPSKMFPGEFRKRGLVTIELDRLSAALFAPEKLAALDKSLPGQAIWDSVAIEENYVVSAYRLDGVWDYSIEHDGVLYRIPEKVLDRLMSYRQGIIAEGRKVRGKEVASRRKYSNNGAAPEAEDLDVDPAWAQANADPRDGYLPGHRRGSGGEVTGPVARPNSIDTDLDYDGTPDH